MWNEPNQQKNETVEPVCILCSQGSKLLGVNINLDSVESLNKPVLIFSDKEKKVIHYIVQWTLNNSVKSSFKTTAWVPLLGRMAFHLKYFLSCFPSTSRWRFLSAGLQQEMCRNNQKLLIQVGFDYISNTGRTFFLNKL